MKTITSETKNAVWLSIFFSIVFFGAMGFIMFYLFHRTWIKNEIESKSYLMLAFGLFIFFIGYSFVKTYINKSSRIIIDIDKITVKGNSYYWKNIKDVVLSEKRGFGFFNYPMEVTTLHFDNEITIYIYDDMFSNTWRIKSFIKQIVVNKTDYTEIDLKKVDSKLINEDFEEFKGSAFFSFRGVLMWSLILFFAFLLLFTKGKISKPESLLYFGPVGLLWFGFNAYCMNYFGTSKNYFRINNHYFWWVNDIYRNSEIELIVFESQPKQSNKLRIITKDFKHKIYFAGSLTDKKWLQMKEELERKNISVRNECI